MNDTPILPPTDLYPSSPEKVEPPIDPRLIERAIKRMKGLVKGNGITPDDVSLIDHGIHIIRFNAQTRLKIVTEYGTRVEAGRNTTAKLATTAEDFQRILGNVVIDTVKNPEKRQQIIDTVFARSDKGFGLEEQKLGFHNLNETLVQHERCVNCKGTGKCTCAHCQGHQLVNCPNCQGRRQIVCPRCRGTSHVQTSNGQKRCETCHAHGRIMCPKCAGRGQMKCFSCKGAGFMVCQNCASTGWLSHMTQVKVLAQMTFTFEREKLPPILIEGLEKFPNRLVLKHDIEVAIVPEKKDPVIDTRKKDDDEPVKQDTIVIDYNVTCPIGPISFQLKDKTVAGYLFGYQARFAEMPPFLEGLIQKGIDALREVSLTQSVQMDVLHRATQYSLIRDVFTKLVFFKSPLKAHTMLHDKYGAGIKQETTEGLVRYADIVLRNITRIPRYIGMAIGLAVFAIGEWASVQEGLLQSLPAIFYVIVIGVIWPMCGFGLSLLGARTSAVFIQRKRLKGIVEDELLRKNFPKPGKTIWWSAAFILLTTVGVIFWGIKTGVVISPF